VLYKVYQIIPVLASLVQIAGDLPAKVVVPVKSMYDAFGSASRMCLAKPSMKSYWLRCASSAMAQPSTRSLAAW
jgi:hypothetical protein